jgi:hypothetical protein
MPFWGCPEHCPLAHFQALVSTLGLVTDIGRHLEVSWRGLGLKGLNFHQIQLPWSQNKADPETKAAIGLLNLSIYFSEKLAVSSASFCPCSPLFLWYWVSSLVLHNYKTTAYIPSPPLY